MFLTDDSGCCKISFIRNKIGSAAHNKYDACNNGVFHLLLVKSFKITQISKLKMRFCFL